MMKQIVKFLAIILAMKLGVVESREYSGDIRVNFEVESDTYIIFENYKFDSKNELQIYFLEPKKGGLKGDLERTEQYVFRFVLKSEADDLFDAIIEIHEKTFSEVSKLNSYRRIIKQFVKGELNKKNEFRVSTVNGPQLSVKLRIDKTFTLEEIKARFIKAEGSSRI